MRTEEPGRGSAPGGHRVALTGAGRRYGQVRALAGVDLEVEAGRFLVLLGPSGSGKTTLIRALAGIERLDEGEIRIGEQLASGPRKHLPPEARDLAMVFQDYALWPHLTAAGNVGYALRRRKLTADQSRARSLEMLERVGLAGLAERYPHELSGGQQQRVALARAIVARPGLLLFDEPLSNLDTDLRERLRVEISTLTRESGATAVYITHDQSEAFAIADVIGVLDQAGWSNWPTRRRSTTSRPAPSWPASPDSAASSKASCRQAAVPTSTSSSKEDAGDYGPGRRATYGRASPYACWFARPPPGSWPITQTPPGQRSPWAKSRVRSSMWSTVAGAMTTSSPAATALSPPSSPPARTHGARKQRFRSTPPAASPFRLTTLTRSVTIQT